MKLRRGMIVTVALQGDLGKPRPAVVMQADEYIEAHQTVLVMPMSSFQANAAFIRPSIVPSAENGLLSISQIMTDKITPVRKTAIGQTIGVLSDSDMERVESALINIAGLRKNILPIQMG